MPQAIVIIPARYASKRFPGKVLADATGKPLIQYVYERGRRAACAADVLVAADDERIVAAVQAFGGRAVMTRPDHPNGTCRIAEVAATLDAEFIVNIQCDEPDIDPKLIDLAVQTLASHGDCSMSTVASHFADDEDPADPNIVKVVVDRSGCALYFGRSLMPFNRDGVADPPAVPLKHVGMYVYRRPFLAEYVALPATPLEQTEKLEQLRALEHGRRIAVAIAEAHHHGIDTPEQYEAFARRCAAGEVS